MKVYLFVLLVHFRDIDQGKGLRNPFIEGILEIYKYNKLLVLDIVKHIPQFGYYKDLCRLFNEAEKNKYNDLKEVIVDYYLSRLEEELNSNKIDNAAKFAPREQKKYHSFAVALAIKKFKSQSKNYMKDYRVYI
jgi:hypothetical protein